ETAAVVWWQGAKSERHALLVRTPPVLRTLGLLFVATAEPAPSLEDFRRTSHRRGCAHTQEILGFLARGVKDEVASRELGISIRTYRRHVSDLLRELGVTSRFQAGAAAAQLRLLAPAPAGGRGEAALPAARASAAWPLAHAN
ncbi:LuxR family transcriptional regulator, partial [Motilibacter sp. E257]